MCAYVEENACWDLQVIYGRGSGVKPAPKSSVHGITVKVETH